MIIFGHEYKFAFTVGAQKEMQELRELQPVGKNSDPSAKIAIILSKWHEEAESLQAQAEGREYVPQPLSEEVIEHLTFVQMNELMVECNAAMKRDTGRTVETETGEGEKKTGVTADS